MEDNDLKKIWKEMHTGMECKSIDIKEIIHKNFTPSEKSDMFICFLFYFIGNK